MVNQATAHPRATIAWLEPCGFLPDAALLAAAAAARLRVVADAGPADVAIVDLRGATEIADDAARLFAAARRLAPGAGFLSLLAPGADAAMRAQARRSGDIVFAGEEPAPVIAAILDRLRLAALADETADRIRSRLAAGLPVGFPKLDPAAPTLSILVAGKPSPLTLQAVNAVRARSFTAACVFSAGQTMRALDHQHFDGAVLLPSDENDLLIALARALRRHGEHRRLAVLMATPDEALAARLSRRDGFETIAPAHIDDDLSARLERAARCARIAAAMRDYLKSPDAGADPRTGAVGPRFFAQHAARIFRRADEAARPVTLVGLWRESDARTGAESADADQMRDVVRMARRLVRAEDLVGRMSRTLMVIAMRGVDGGDGARAAERLEGVISGSLGRVSGMRCVRALALEREPETSLETSLARLIRLDRDSAATPRTAS